MSGVICGAVIGAVVGGGLGLHNISSYNKNLTKAFKKQMQAAQKNYNYQQAALQTQQTSAYHQAVGQLFNISYQALQNNATIYTALGQSGYEGRNANKISSAIQGQTGRAKTAVKDSYKDTVSNIRSKKDALYITMINDVENAKDNLSGSYKHGFSAFMEVADMSAKGAAIGATMGAAAGAAMGAGATAGQVAGQTAGQTAMGAGASKVSTGFWGRYGNIKYANKGLFNFLDTTSNFTSFFNQSNRR